MDINSQLPEHSQGIDIIRSLGQIIFFIRREMEDVDVQGLQPSALLTNVFIITHFSVQIKGSY
jgi:hypothetical protein